MLSVSSMTRVLCVAALLSSCTAPPAVVPARPGVVHAPPPPTTQPSGPPELPPPPLPPLPRERLAAAIERTLAATVRVTSLVSSIGWERDAAGVAVSTDGLVLTAASVVDRDASVRVMVRGVARSARVVWMDEERDLALLDTSVRFDAPLALLRAPVVTGMPVVCGDFPDRAAEDALPVAGVGSIGATDRAVELQTWPARRDPERHEHVIDAPGCVEGSASGGSPLVTLDGAVVAVTIAGGAAATPLAGLSERLPPPLAQRLRWSDEVPRADTRTRDARFGHEAPTRALEALSASVIAMQGPGGVTGSAVVVAPGLALTSSLLVLAEAPGSPVDPQRVEVRGELALVRIADLRVPPIPHPMGEASVGDPVFGARAAGEPYTHGVLTAVGREPGTIESAFAHTAGCGTRRRQVGAANPAITLGRTVIHDTAELPRGALLVDRHGRPYAIQVASAAWGVGYAVPLREALARFEALR